MNTAAYAVPILPATGGHEFVLEDLELAFPKEQLTQITKQWNKGWEIEKIAENMSREPDEVFLALFHQARRGRIKRPFAYQVKKPLTEYQKDKKYKAVVDVKKTKNEIPTVIEIDGKRYVHEPKGR